MSVFAYNKSPLGHFVNGLIKNDRKRCSRVFKISTSKKKNDTHLIKYAYLNRECLVVFATYNGSELPGTPEFGATGRHVSVFYVVRPFISLCVVCG